MDVLTSLHGTPAYHLGQYAIASGKIMASADEYNISFIGKSAHASRPVEGRNALLAASHAVIALQEIVSNEVKTKEEAVVNTCVLKCGTAALALLGLAIAITGYAIRGVVVPQHWLFPLGLTYEGFTSSDYFPLFPQLGYFLIGAAIGKTAYREKRTFLPGAFQQTPVARFFCWCVRQ